VKYLEALNSVNNSDYNKNSKIKIISSFNSDPINLFLKAIFLKKKINLNIATNPFNTLKQSLINPELKKNTNIVLLCPWDFVENLNWRSDPQIKTNYFKDIKEDIDFLIKLILSKKKYIKVIYFDLPYPKTLINSGENTKLYNYINKAVIQTSDLIIKYNFFDIAKFIDIGFPFKTKNIYDVAKKIYDLYSLEKPLKKRSFKKKNLPIKNYDIGSKKILATDFDGVLWNGIVSDDGYKNIKCSNNIIGFKHFLYQSLIKKLINRGVILIGVTRNKLVSAKKGFSNEGCLLKQDDFVKIFATFDNKSKSIKKAYTSLNLSMNSVVFIDDNLIEISEVKKSLPRISTILFPNKEDEMPEFIEKINNFFQKNYVTKEDKIRLDNYKNTNFQKNFQFKSTFNLKKFLKSLNMNLLITKKTLQNKNELARPLQLINKTNQFNLNGIRLSENKLYNILKNNGSLYSGLYKDKTGDYGEIIVILIDNKNKVLSFAMSCRVLQKDVEIAFLSQLLIKKKNIKNFLYKRTTGNILFQEFFDNKLKKNFDKKNSFFDINQFLKTFKKNNKNYKFKFSNIN
jgi:FkbH-like protein